MNKCKIFLILLMTVGIVSLAYAQQNPDHLKIEEASGKVLKVKAQESVIYLSSFGNQMVFFVPKEAIISRETLPATLGDIREGDSVSVRYYNSSEAVYVVVSINGSKALDASP
ncbi:MAG: hypothetical protein HQL15_02835 [Candidatus Omnitrophica bacterium]|nr:hypothetical protein [Candidatus Omnitrophota bacterium]